MSCEGFVEALASAAPAPGGGGAAALVAAIGMALGNMVGSLTVGKKKYADVERDIIELKKQADSLQQRLIDLVAKDAEVFIPLSKAYGLPRDTSEEKAYKEEVMEKCLRACCEVPLDIMKASCEAIDLHEEFAAKGASLAISDVGCGVICCKAALQAASLNVLINTASMKDLRYAEQARAEMYGMLDAYMKKADAIFKEVEERLI